MHRRRTHRDERGVTVVIFGAAAMLLLVMVAVVVDLSMLRDDRRADQKIADAASSSAALVLATEDGLAACETALAYLEANTEGVSSFSGADCSDATFPGGSTGPVPEFCDPTTKPATVTGTADDYAIRFVHPVPDTHDLMQQASVIGASAAPVTADDGTQCDRVAIEVELLRDPQFGGIVGNEARTTSVHAVAKANTTVGGYRPINLLILERTECEAIKIGGNPEIVIGAITGHDGEILPGIVAVDSIGSEPVSCGTTAGPKQGTLYGEGNTAFLHADGPAGCPTEIFVHPKSGAPLTPAAGVGVGCGIIELLASGVPGPPSPLYCSSKTYWPACTSTAYVRPHPLRMLERRTREPVDHHFNCVPDYSSRSWFVEQSIGGCPSWSDDTDYVDELRSFTNGTTTPAGFNVYGDSAGEPCTVEGGSTPEIVVPEGNTHVVCSPFTVKRPVTFTGGNVIFDGDVVVTSGGDLRIHACGQEGTNDCNPVVDLPADWERGDAFDERAYSSDMAWVAFRSGAGLQKDAQASVRIYDATVFLPADADVGGKAVALAGGSGALNWYAPRSGPFDVLSMWSDATTQHDMAGGSNLAMEGVYFAPSAKLVFSGQTDQDQVAAQLIVEKLEAKGSGTVTIVPQIDRSLPHFIPPESILLR